MTSYVAYTLTIVAVVVVVVADLKTIIESDYILIEKKLLICHPIYDIIYLIHYIKSAFDVNTALR